jgi:CO/xanthine dehydrogenase FAD-binding subunit
MQTFDLIRPSTESEILQSLATEGSIILAGGTDLLPRLRRSDVSPPVLVDISRVKSLDFIRIEDSELAIGALTRHAYLAESGLVLAHAPALAQAVQTIGCPQTRERATLGGNLVNASPAADTVPPLLTLDASVRLAGPTGTRSLLLAEFLLGPGRTALQAPEYLHSVRFPLPRGNSRGAYLKLGKRSGMAIALASAAVNIQYSRDRVIEIARAALGSVAPTAVRSPHVEQALLGKRLDEVAPPAAAARVQEDIPPIDDIRASAAYRRSSAEVILRRALEAALSKV